MQFIQGLGLDVVLAELSHMQPGVAHSPAGLPTAGEVAAPEAMARRQRFRRK
jgi:hypothetical protein